MSTRAEKGEECMAEELDERREERRRKETRRQEQ